MPYLQVITKAGKTIEIERYFSSRYKKQGIKRSDKIKPTKEEQQRVNNRKAEKTLRRLINTNYGYGDYHLNMGYVRKQGDPYRTKEQMRKDMDIFLRSLRKVYQKADIPLKYIHVMEIGEKGSRHHHLIINQGVPTREIQKCWSKAYSGRSTIHFSPLDDSGNYAKLAAYLIKYTCKTIGTEKALQGKRWNSSKNLIKPMSTVKVISDREQFKAEPTERKGYYIDKASIRSGVHSPEYYGYGFLSYILVELKNQKRKGVQRE